jgi:hypothetical protein
MGRTMLKRGGRGKGGGGQGEEEGETSLTRHKYFFLFNLWASIRKLVFLHEPRLSMNQIFNRLRAVVPACFSLTLALWQT